MMPSCREGDFALVLPFVFFRPKIHDVVVLKNPKNSPLTKTLMGDSSALLLKRVISIQRRGRQKWYWLEGDAVQDSFDSQDFGWIPEEFILGKAYIIKNEKRDAGYVLKHQRSIFSINHFSLFL